MATIRERNGRFELRVKHRLLPKVFTATFTDEISARNYGLQLESLLAQGLVPQELVGDRGRGTSPTLHRVMSDYLAFASPSKLDRDLLHALHGQLATLRLEQVMQYRWVESWVRSLKMERNLAPGTIRKRVGALARLFDWHLTREATHGQQPLANPFRLLPHNYAAYNAHERAVLIAVPGKAPKSDIERDRRLAPGEAERIERVLLGAGRPDRERPLQLPVGDALCDLFHLITHTGLRLREAYALRARHVQLHLRTIHVEKGKTGVARDVPIVPALFPMLQRRLAAVGQQGPDCPIFPWWNGERSDRELKRVTGMLSQAFSRAFAYAGVDDLREHDLRHEAICRWVTMRDRDGGWMYRAEELMRITGHRNPRTFMRYVSLRGSDLAERLWPHPP